MWQQDNETNIGTVNFSPKEWDRVKTNYNLSRVAISASMGVKSKIEEFILQHILFICPKFLLITLFLQLSGGRFI